MVELIFLFSLATLFLILSCVFFKAWYRLSDGTRDKTFEIAVLGPSGVGKTLFLSTLMRQLTENPEIHESLLGKYLSDDEEKKLREIGSFQKDIDTGYYLAGKRSTRQIVETEIKRYQENKTRGTEKPENFWLEVWGKLSDQKNIYRKILWRDIPGGYFEVQEDWSYNGIGEILNQAKGIFLLIDSANLTKVEQCSQNEKEGADEKRSQSGTSTVKVQKASPSVSLQNYVEAVSSRLRKVKKEKDKFPVWLVFTKGDLLPPELQKRSEKEWMLKTSQVSALAEFEMEQIAILATLVSIEKEKNVGLYNNIGNTMKRFYHVILEEMDKKDRQKMKKRQRNKRLSVLFLVFFAWLILELGDAFRFSRLPVIKGEEQLKEEQLNLNVNRLCSYIQSNGLTMFYIYHRPEAKRQLASFQKKLVIFIEDKMNGLELQDKKYRSYLQSMVDGISLLRLSGSLLESIPSNLHLAQEFVSKLQEWDQLVGQDDTPEYKTNPKIMVAFYHRLPTNQIHLKDEVKDVLKKILEGLMDGANEEASSYTGKDFYPQRLKPLIQWYKDFGSIFPDLHEKYQKCQNSHWDYCWKRYLQNFEAQTYSMKKAEVLREFREQMPEQTFEFQKCPEFILKDWHNVTSNLLTSWDTEDDPNLKRQKDAMIEWFKSYLSEVDSLLVECRQFEKKIEVMLRELFQSDKEKGALKMNKIQDEMEFFFHKYQNEKKIQEISSKWQKRYNDLKKFQEKRAVKLMVKEYGCKKNIPNRLWDDSTWEKLYLYLRIDMEGTPPIILDLRNGALNYQGSYEVKQEVLWKPWLQIQVRFMDADGDIDKEALVDDDVLCEMEFRNVFSILDLTEKRQEKMDKEEVQFWFKIDLADTPIPQWLLDIYKK